MFLNNLALVNYGMGTLMIGIFALVCLVLSMMVVRMVNSDKKKKE
ncbi:MAG: hypothetical protein WBV11_02850 [Salegentibacter sp.]